MDERETQVAPATTSRAGARMRVEVIRSGLRADGYLDTAQFSRLSDYVNNSLGGYCRLQDATLYWDTGAPAETGLELHVKLDELVLIAQTRLQPRPLAPEQVVPKTARRLLFITPALRVSALAYLHVEGSLDGFLDASDPPFIPLTHVHVRWHSGHQVGHYPFALLQRRYVVGVAAEAAAVPARRTARAAS
ncbi:MAG: hypothetical protein M0Z49_01550 [Chloroflexi bacterium]|nr:hypothetical protein [Chloroflexota bacterium]